MIVELHNKLGSPEQIEATRLVLRSADGQALCVAMQVGPDNYFIVHRGDGDEAMQRALRGVGLDETVMSNMLDMPTPPGTLWKPGDNP